MSKKIAIITLVVIALIAAGVTVTYIARRQANEEMEEQPVTALPKAPKEPLVQPKEQVIQPEEPTTTEPIDTSGWKIYRGTEFEFKYPSDFMLFEGDSAKYSSGVLFPPPFIIGEPIVRVSFPESKYRGSNLIEASLTVNIYPKERTPECLQGVYTQQELSERENINGIDFFIERWSEGGMGHRYEVISYRTIRQERCYAMNLVLYWTTLIKEKGLFEFNKTEILKALTKILSTFKFVAK